MGRNGDIPKPPARVTDAGLDFSYAVWNANTEVTLTTVPWDSTYRDLVKFPTRAALDNYLTLRPNSLTLSGLSRMNLNLPIRLKIRHETAMRYNYVRAHNPAYYATGSGPSTYYYFITDVRWLATDTTELTLQLDVWQTFGDQVKFGNCYIEQGHIGIANENQMQDNGREFLSIPEGLDMGNEYVIDSRQSYTLADVHTPSTSPGVIVTSTAKLDGNVGDYGNVRQPTIRTAEGSTFQDLPNGATMYYFESVARFKTAMEQLSIYPWVSQNITSVMLVPDLRKFSTQTDLPLGKNINIASVPAIELTRALYPLELTFSLSSVGSWPAGSRYSTLKKFRMSPYTMVEVTLYNSNPLMLKPESWERSGATGTDVKIIAVLHAAHPSPRLMIYPYRYNAGGVQPETAYAPASTSSNSKKYVVNDGGEFLDVATGIYNFPTFSVVNNAATIALANQAHSIQFQYTNANWAYTKAMQGASVTYDQASSGIDLSQGLMGVESDRLRSSQREQKTTLANQANMSLGNSALGALGSVTSGNAAGAAGQLGSGLLNATIGLSYQQDAVDRQTMVAQQALAGNNRLTVGNAEYMRDTNRALAQFSAKGDYQNDIARINAQVQDLALTPPSVVGQTGGEAFMLSTSKWVIDVKVKKLQGGAIRSIGEYWLRYGYKVNQYAVPPQSLMVMDKFTYWKMSESYLTTYTCPETFRQAIRGIFEKGVTVWADPAYIGTIDLATNKPLSGVSL